MKKKCFLTKKERKEIFYNVINTLLLTTIAFISGVVAVEAVTFRVVFVSLLMGFIVGLTKFKEYWDGEKTEYSTKLFTVVSP